MSINIINSNSLFPSTISTNLNLNLEEFQEYLQRVNQALEKSLSVLNSEYKPSFTIQQNNGFIFFDQLDFFFASTGLIIRPYGFQDTLSANEISIIDYLATKKYIKMIAEKSKDAKIKISNKTTSEFRKLALFDLIILMSRKTSRDLLNYLLTSNNVVKMRNARTMHLYHWNPSSRYVNIVDSPVMTFAGTTEKGEKFLSPNPRFTRVGHEFIHAFQLELYGKSIFSSLFREPPTNNPNYHIRLEEITVKGNFQFPYALYSYISEQNICKDFGLPSRDDHLGSPFNFVQPVEEVLINGDTTIHDAAMLGANLNLEVWFKNGGKIETLYRGFTVLHKAIYCRQSTTVDLLLNNGAPLDYYNAKGYLPIHVAIVSNATHIFWQLIRAGANAHAKTREGVTSLQLALQLALQNKNIDENILAFLQS
jgi:hypothetical protein